MPISGVEKTYQPNSTFNDLRNRNNSGLFEGNVLNAKEQTEAISENEAEKIKAELTGIGNTINQKA